MINRNLVLASSLLVLLLNIVALVYLYSQSNQLEQKIIELESNKLYENLGMKIPVYKSKIDL